MTYHHSSEMRLYSDCRQRLYLNAAERQRFAHAAQQQEIHICTLCLCLLYTGCRISEATHIHRHDIQYDEATVVINSLKKRNKVHLRAVPVPDTFTLLVRDWTDAQTDNSRLWPIDRVTAWRWVKVVMREANIQGRHASPKGLRHSFGINAVMHSIPLNVVQKWMGHADMKTTAIYVLRSANEPFLIGTIGKPKTARNVRSVIEGKVREHSRKPDEAFTAAENLIPNARRVELFSRQQRPGWDSWGHEAGKFDEIGKQ